MDAEFSGKQIKRIDEVENASFDFAKVLVEDQNLKWDMSFIGEIADCVSKIMVNHGFKVRYPAMIENADGNIEIQEYFE